MITQGSQITNVDDLKEYGRQCVENTAHILSNYPSTDMVWYTLNDVDNNIVRQYIYEFNELLRDYHEPMKANTIGNKKISISLGHMGYKVGDFPVIPHSSVVHIHSTPIPTMKVTITYE